ncbi:hypothetical protein LINGRAHAP2_LOCUS8192 [Linum grandiflorum]
MSGLNNELLDDWNKSELGSLIPRGCTIEEFLRKEFHQHSLHS